MRRIALDDAADDDHGIHALLFHDSRSPESQLDRSRHVDDVDIILLHPVLNERVDGSLRHGVRDLAIPIRYYNRIALTSEDISARQLGSVIF